MLGKILSATLIKLIENELSLALEFELNTLNVLIVFCCPYFSQINNTQQVFFLN